MIRAMRIAACALLLFSALALSSVPSSAFSGSEQDSARQAVESGQARPLKDILRQLRGQMDGRVLDAQLDSAGGRSIYLIKVLGRDGRVRILSVDALSGQVLQVMEGGG
jgi:uncharacterized membrane protein YkoI